MSEPEYANLAVVLHTIAYLIEKPPGAIVMRIKQCGIEVKHERHPWRQMQPISSDALWQWCEGVHDE